MNDFATERVRPHVGASNQPSRRYVLTSFEEESSACSQTSIMHHW